MTQDKPTVESFIEKWLVGYESLEQKLEFGIEMKADLASLTPSNEKYWRERCEAAEGVIERFVVSPLHPDTSDNGKKIFAEWQELKSTPIPIQTPCVELEKEVERLKGLIEMNWKEEYDQAVNEIVQLQDQLKEAENEIRELNRNL
jgi:predicted RNase H-like nuclease (RuvC/YqgF family)